MAWPRIHRANGDVFDLPFVEPDQEAEYAARWREAHARVEWLTTAKGRLDKLLPQTLPRIVHNANARSYSERGRERKTRPSGV